MFAYLANIALLALWALILLWQNPDEGKRRLFCILAAGQWIILSGLRHISIGADTYAYKVVYFEPILRTPWSELLHDSRLALLGALEFKDPGFSVFVKLTQLVTADYQVFLVIVAVAFTVPLALFIYRYSADPFLSFLLYSTLFYEFFAITGLRQTIATALVVLVGYRLVVDRRFITFLLVFLIAFTIHRSAITFVPFYFLAPRPITRARVLAYLAAVPFVFVFRRDITLWLGVLLGYERYGLEYVTYGIWIFASMLLLVLVVSLVRAPVALRDNPNSTHWYNALLLAVLFTPLTNMRVVQYFSIFLILLVPQIARSFRDRNEQALAYLTIIGVLMLLLIRNDPAYLFYWQSIGS